MKKVKKETMDRITNICIVGFIVLGLVFLGSAFVYEYYILPNQGDERIDLVSDIAEGMIPEGVEQVSDVKELSIRGELRKVHGAYSLKNCEEVYVSIQENIYHSGSYEASKPNDFMVSVSGYNGNETLDYSEKIPAHWRVESGECGGAKYYHYPDAHLLSENDDGSYSVRVESYKSYSDSNGDPNREK